MSVRNILLASLLVTAGLAFAEDDADQKNTVNNQQLSKRPYVATRDPTEKYQDATASKDTARQAQHQKTLNLHMLGKRPWSEKASD